MKSGLPACLMISYNIGLKVKEGTNKCDEPVSRMEYGVPVTKYFESSESMSKFTPYHSANQKKS